MKTVRSILATVRDNLGLAAMAFIGIIFMIGGGASLFTHSSPKYDDGAQYEQIKTSRYGPVEISKNKRTISGKELNLRDRASDIWLGLVCSLTGVGLIGYVGYVGYVGWLAFCVKQK